MVCGYFLVQFPCAITNPVLALSWTINGTNGLWVDLVRPTVHNLSFNMFTSQSFVTLVHPVASIYNLSKILFSLTQKQLLSLDGPCPNPVRPSTGAWPAVL